MPATEADLLDLLTARRELDPDSDEARQLGRDIAAQVETELKDDLRSILQSNGFDVGPEQAERRLTELLQRFSQKILSRCPPGMLHAQTRIELLLYVAGALSNMLRTHYRDRTRRDGHQTALEQLAKLREERLAADCPDGRLYEVLELLADWDQGTDEQRLWAQAVRYYYVVGMRESQIDRQLQATEKVTLQRLGAQLGMSKSAAGRLLEEALKELRKALLA